MRSGATMNAREQRLATLRYEKPDRIPFAPGGPRESTLKAWHRQGLPEGVNWLEFLCQELGVERPAPCRSVWPEIHFEMMPQFEQKVLERKPGTLVVQDW